MVAKTANNSQTDKPKRKAPPKAWKPGQSGNPNGRPREGESWAGIIRELSNMTADEMAEMVGPRNELGQQLKKLPKNVQMKKLIVARVMTSLMFEPTSSLLNTLMERAEGKVPDVIDATIDGVIGIDLVKRSLKKVYGNDSGQ